MVDVARIKHASGFSYMLAQDGGGVADANAFLASLLVRGLSETTVRAYAFDLAAVHRWLSATERPVSALDPKDVLDFIACEQLRGASPASINRRLSTLRLFFRFVACRDLDDGAGGRPTKGYYKGRGKDRALGLHALPSRRPVVRVKLPRKIVDPLTAGEIRYFIRRTKRYRDLAVVYLLLLCGLRSCEVLAARVGDLDLANARLLVRGKGKKERMLPLPPTVRTVVTRYLALERPKAAATDRLFVVLQGRRRGTPMTPAGLRNLFRHRRKARPLARANPHRFRHTFGADMARAGVSLAVLQKMMGHADGKTTLGYIELAMADVAAAYQRAIDHIAQRYDDELTRTF